MNVDALITALDLPASSRVDKRIPKKLLIENGAFTAADKRYINDGIEEFFWLAALKPTTIGVPAYRDSAKEYLEIAVLRLKLRPRAKTTRLVELVHRAVPYPALLMTEQEKSAGISAAHKRWAQNEAGKTVLEGEVVSVGLDNEAGHWPAFREALALGRQPRVTLYVLYQGWINTLLAFKAALVIGEFRISSDPEDAKSRQEALIEIERLNIEISQLRNAASKEKQIARQVELNFEVKRLEKQLATARGRL